MRKKFSRLLVIIVLLLLEITVNAQKRIYIANDDHTDYMWTANEIDYDSSFLHMLDYWINHNTATASNPPDYRSKWACDGSFWISRYEKYRSASDFTKLINQIRSGQITVPYSPLIVTYGTVPTEAVLRGMYYAGDLERRFNLDLDMAIAMENQTLPLGLSSLWKGAGAKYCWHGVCGCATNVPGLNNRPKEIYWYKGLDTNKILLKWYSLNNSNNNADLGGYGEARNPGGAITKLALKCNTGAYPYNIAGGFGVGWDDLVTTSDNLIAAAQTNSNASQRVIVSNEVDFFQDFESTYGNSLTNITETHGNEWEFASASIAEISAKIKRSLEKLRAAEAMAAIAINYEPAFMTPLDSLRKEAWMALGLYWEHDFGFAGTVSLAERNAFQRRLEITFTSYVDQLFTLARSNLANLITNNNGSTRFFAFNPLGWLRSDYADYEYSGSANVHVMDVTKNTEIPFQFITKNNINYLRILADSIPSVGYRVFEIQNGPGLTVFPNAGTNTGNVVETDSFKVTYTNQGVLTSILDKKNGNKEIVLATNGKYVNDLGSGLGNAGSSTVESNGPVSITIRTITTSPFKDTTRITLFKKNPRIEIDNKIAQQFSTVETWSYSFNITAPTVWHEETGAVIKAKLTTNGGHYATQNARYDWSTLNHFASVNETNYGVTLSNQDCYFMQLGNSTPNTLNENTAQLNVLAGGLIDGHGIVNQGGDNIFNQRFAITTHTAYTAAAEMKKALEHQTFMVCGSVTNPGNFLLPNEYSFVSNSDTGSVIWSIKPAEEQLDGGIVTRVWNLNNTDANPVLTYNLFINEAKRITHVETDMNINPFNGKDLLTALGHNEMKTYRVKLAVIPLPVKLISFSGDKAGETNELKWSATTESTLKIYELERSANGQNFIKIATVAARPGPTNSYNYSDKNINVALPYYYRLKIINNNNSFNYSNTIIIKAAKGASDLLVYPNPVNDNLKLNLVLDKQTRCNITVVNTAGVIVKTVLPPLFEKGNNYYTLPVKGLPSGEYNIFITAGDKKFIQGFIKN